MALDSWLKGYTDARDAQDAKAQEAKARSVIKMSRTAMDGLSEYGVSWRPWASDSTIGNQWTPNAAGTAAPREQVIDGAVIADAQLRQRLAAAEAKLAKLTRPAKPLVAPVDLRRAAPGEDE